MDNNTSIILIGFMGSGKTTIGQELANLMDREFIDLDKEIERKYNLKTTEIFEKYGETVFRQEEKRMVIHFAKQKNKVISLGGGAFLQNEVRDFCLENGIVIYLEIEWEAWLQRLDELISDRPLLQGKSINEIKQLFDTRREIYERNHIRIITDHQTVAETALQIKKETEDIATQ
ncbi:shikimate kinase [Virgibacillus sp. SK37]|uniref:shikimate kinase n=1 Tax=Virgibacillus sp. SK37 TaxID=403957 RepID=UPI0004D1ABC6|nr:shikimate kinase [Virgibacillus sp. SK37]AIF44118.1 shikimate kinase [Virgibacillus sp. SK37]